MANQYTANIYSKQKINEILSLYKSGISYTTISHKFHEKKTKYLLNNHENRGVFKKFEAYHLDHKYSIFESLKNNIKSEIISSLNNLEFIPWRDNVVKETNCLIIKKELINI